MSAVTVYVWPGTDDVVRLSGRAASVLLTTRPSTAQVLRVLPELHAAELIEHVQVGDWLTSTKLTTLGERVRAQLAAELS